MAIKEKEVTVEGGADAGKRFVVKRMSAWTADKWARHLVAALTRAGTKLPDDAMSVGLSGLAGMGLTIFSHLSDEEADKAWEGLDACIVVRPDANNPVFTRKLDDSDMDDPQTLSFLRAEAFYLNLDFLKAAINLLSPLVAALLPGKSEEPQPAV